MFFLAISLYSGKFPPELKSIKESINQLAQAKEKYAALMHKSENYIRQMESNKMKPAKNPSLMGAAAPNNGEYEDVQLQLKNIKSQMNRIEVQNNIIINSLRK